MIILDVLVVYTIAYLLELALGFAFMLHTDSAASSGEIGCHNGTSIQTELEMGKG